jgi:hypothetical protein
LLLESGLEIDERYFPWSLSRSFRAKNRLWSATPGCTGGYSYRALSELLIAVHGMKYCTILVYCLLSAWKRWCNLKNYNLKIAVLCL